MSKSLDFFKGILYNCAGRSKGGRFTSRTGFFALKKGGTKPKKDSEKSRKFFLENAKKSLTNLLGCGKMFRLSVATDAKHLTDVSAKNIDNCIEQVKVGKNIFSVNMQITITNCEFASNKKE